MKDKIKEDIFANTVIYIPLEEGKMVPLKLQISNGSIALLAQPGSGEMGEKEALDLMETLAQKLREQKISFGEMERKYQEGKKIDMVVIATFPRQ